MFSKQSQCDSGIKVIEVSPEFIYFEPALEADTVLFILLFIDFLSYFVLRLGGSNLNPLPDNLQVPFTKILGYLMFNKFPQWSIKLNSAKLLILLVVLFSCSSFAQEFRFIVLGDSQFENPNTFKKIVHETELLKPAFVMHVGDMIHGYTYDINTARKQWKRFKRQISPLTMPFYPTPGNHDVTTKEIQPAYIEAWGKDKLFYSFDYGNSHFIVLNVFLDQQFDTIPPNEMEWLKKDLEKSKSAENIFLSMHAPLYLEKKLFDWKPVEDLIAKYNVKGIFSGHFHIYDHRVIKGIDYFCLNSSGNMNLNNFMAGYGHGFLYVTVNGAKISYAFITKGGVYPIDTVAEGQSTKSPKYYNPDRTILIHNPAEGAIDTTGIVKIHNRTKDERTYTLTWHTKDFRWKCTPYGEKVKVGPGETKEFKFHINGPSGNFTRNDLPEIKITSPFTTLSGAVTHSINYYKLFDPPWVDAYKTNKGIVLDGKPDEDAWKNVKGINQLYTDAKGTPAETKTNVKLLYDENNLYVSVVGEEPHPENLSAKAYGDIPLVFGDDDFELFFDTNRDQSTFFRLMVNSKGTVLCSSPKGLFTIKFDVKTYVGKDYWSAEFKIPFSQMNVSKPKAGDVWGFNVLRHRLQSKIQQSDWSIMQYYLPYQPEYFGMLKFE